MQNGGTDMNRDKIYNEIKETLGIVPTFLKSVSDTRLAQEWELFKHVQLEEGVIPGKYKELIGLGIAAATKCHYCTLFHTEKAKLQGATAAEVEEAVSYAKETSGWSTYINGMRVDYEQFKREVGQIVEHMNRTMR
ncbi:MAG: carboxymuconolactone decarboxylase family protein [Myxococcales bacterium]|nr:MAG: carboxymuconolactone decarboxylase family protein [Myxococcales bacterium]